MLNNQSLTNAEHTIRSFRLIIPHTVSLKDALDPKYYNGVAKSFSMRGLIQGSRVRLDAEDFAFCAECVVTDIGANYIKFAVMSKYEGEAISKDLENQDSHLKVEWKGGTMKACIIDSRTSTVIEKGIKSKADAFKRRDELLALEAA